MAPIPFFLLQFNEENQPYCSRYHIMNGGCDFLGHKHVFHSSVRQKLHTLVTFLFEWNFTHL